MNTTVNGSDSNPINDLIAKVMDKFDTDHDKKLSATEFSNFLGGLLGQASGQGAVSTAIADQPSSGAPSAAPKSGPERMDGNGPYRFYLAGFDHNNLDNPGMQTIKYRAARVFIDYKPMPESLPAVVNRLQEIGINAKQMGKDTIDFGDGWGPVDVIQGAYPGGGVAWQWINQQTEKSTT